VLQSCWTSHSGIGTVSLGMATSSLTAAQSAGLPQNMLVFSPRTEPLFRCLYTQFTGSIQSVLNGA